jgi:hypothetical protein
MNHIITMKQLRDKYLKNGTSEQIKKMNRTAMGGRFGQHRAVTPHYVAETSKPGECVLNYGCGVADKNGEIPHSKMLRSHGLIVTDHDIGINARYADAKALECKYDIVMASNVLNVQQTWAMLGRTLAEIASVTRQDGRAVMNFPRKPRRPMQATPEQIESIIQNYFGSVTTIRKGDGHVFEARLPK